MNKRYIENLKKRAEFDDKKAIAELSILYKKEQDARELKRQFRKMLDDVRYYFFTTILPVIWFAFVFACLTALLTHLK